MQPIESEYEDGLYHQIVRYDCGHVVSLTLSSPDPVTDTAQCANCSAPPVVPEWAEAGAKCLELKQQAHERGEQISWRTIGNELGLSNVKVCEMERGRRDPAPLVDWWRNRQIQTAGARFMEQNYEALKSMAAIYDPHPWRSAQIDIDPDGLMETGGSPIT